MKLLASLATPTLALSIALATAACDKRPDAAPAPQTIAAAPEKPGADGSYVVTTATVGDCKAGETCTATLRIVAKSEFHINDEYPYKLKADDAPGVEFLGTDVAGKNVFSKVSSDWQKKDEKSGEMKISFRAADKGTKTVGGTFKLSVCSAQTCQLEQQQVHATVAVK